METLKRRPCGHLYIWAALTTVALGAIVAGRCYAAGGEFEINSLKGLAGVKVVVLDIRSELDASGVTREQLTTDIELRLRQSGVKVLESSELAKAGFPLLFVGVNGATDE